MLLRSEAEGPLSCSWILQPGGSDNGFQEVMLLFTEFLLTCLDSLALYSCEDTICAITSEATMYRGSAVPPLFSSTTPVMLVILTTHQGPGNQARVSQPCMPARLGSRLACRLMSSTTWL